MKCIIFKKIIHSIQIIMTVIIITRVALIKYFCTSLNHDNDSHHHHQGQTNKVKVFLQEFGSSMDDHHDLNQLVQSIKMHFPLFILIINIYQ